MTLLTAAFGREPLADLIDAPWDGSGNVDGVDAGGYTAVVSYTYEADVAGTGVTVTPNGGDTGKTLFIPNAAYRRDTNGVVYDYGDRGLYWSIDEHPSDISWTWRLQFSSTYPSGSIGNSEKLNAFSIRCVRS